MKLLKVEPISNVALLIRLNQLFLVILVRSAVRQCARRLVGVVVRHRGHSQDLARLDVENECAGGFCPIGVRRLGGDLSGDVLDADVDRQPDGLERNSRRQSDSPQIGQALLVEIPLHASQSLIVDIDMAENVRSGAPAGIEAAFFRSEASCREGQGPGCQLAASA